jgi:hypothetical protein
MWLEAAQGREIMSDRETWTGYRRLQRIALVLWGAWFPAMALLIVLPRDWWVWLWGPLMVVGLCWGAVLAYFALRLSYWPCPRCGKFFFLRFGIFPTWSKTCPHCGLVYRG